PIMNFSPHAFSLRQLQYIVAVADLLSFHRAADECHVSQPSLSLQIAEIERVLAITIFERDPHRVALTAAGRDFIESARAVLHAADALAETARRCIDPFSGTLRIGVIPTISPYWLPELTPALRKAYPHLKVIWLEDKTHILVHALQSGSIDAALLALEAEIGDVEREAIAKDPFVLVAPAGKSAHGEKHARQGCRIAWSNRDGTRRRTLLWQTGSGVLLSCQSTRPSVPRNESRHHHQHGRGRHRSDIVADSSGSQRGKN